MTHRRVVFVLILVALVACGRRGHRPGKYAAIEYPETRTVEHVDVYHGKGVRDPYRWLEDAESEETKAWVDAQNEITRGYLDKIPMRNRIRRRLEKLLDFERYGVPFQEGGRYFYKRNDGLQEQSVLMVADSLEGEARVLIDPNTWSADRTVALVGEFPSPDGRFLAYATSSGGSDWREIKVRDIETSQDLAADHLKWIKFSGANWKRDGSGFYYRRLPEPKEGEELSGVNVGGKIYFHAIGTPQDEDKVVYARPDQPTWSLHAHETKDGRYLLIYAFKGASGRNALYFKDLAKDGPVVPLVNDFKSRNWVLHNEDQVFFVYTDSGAPKGRIIEVDLEKPEEWNELVPEDEYPMEDMMVVGDRFLVHYLRRAHSQVKLFRLDGTFEREIKLPALGSAFRFRGQPEHREAFFGFSGFTFPGRAYVYDFDTGELSVFRQPKVEFDPEDFVSTQVAYRGRDGTYITMFVTHRKDLVLDGRNPALLNGYGGFNSSQTPYFSATNVVWMEMGGVFALPNLRGGGEYGNAWHEAGIKKKKQTVFNDFIAAAEALIYNKYTSSEKLAISGGSNGGLLVGACMTQRPELFRACLPAVGVMDMLRYHKFTIGHAWAGEYGTSDDPEMFKVLYAYSPYHRLRKGVEYPATLVTTADRDDRVVPAHSFKFAARLQACQAGPAPVLIRIETRAGHGSGTPISKVLDLQADRLGFLAHTLDIRVGRRFGR